VLRVRSRDGSWVSRIEDSMRLVALVSTGVLCLAPSLARADGPTQTDAFKTRYLDRQRGIMTTLGAWSVGSMGAGAVMLLASRDTEVRYAGLQNLAWGAIDGVFALVGLYQASHERADVHDFAGWRGEQRATEQIFWINAALDLLYVGIGAALAMGGKTDQTRGTGFGVLAQGGFLLTFDTTAALLHGE